MITANPLIRQFNPIAATGAAPTLVTQNVGEPTYRIHDDHPPFSPYGAAVPIAATNFVLSLVGTFEPYYLVEDALPGNIWQQFLPFRGNSALFPAGTVLYVYDIVATPVKSIVQMLETPHTFIPQVHSRVNVQVTVIRAPVSTTDIIG